MASIHRNLRRLCRLLPRTQELHDGYAPTGRNGLRTCRPRHRHFGQRHRLCVLQVPHGQCVRPQRCTKVPSVGTTPLCRCNPTDGHLPRCLLTRHDVHPPILHRLVPRHGLASLRTRHDPLVLHQGARHEDVHLELCTQRRRSLGRPDGCLRTHLVRRLAGRHVLVPRNRCHHHRPHRVCTDS